MVSGASGSSTGSQSPHSPIRRTCAWPPSTIFTDDLARSTWASNSTVVGTGVTRYGFGGPSIDARTTPSSTSTGRIIPPETSCRSNTSGRDVNSVKMP